MNGGSDQATVSDVTFESPGSKNSTFFSNLYSASNLIIVQYPISKRTPRSPFMYFYKIVYPNHLIIAASQPWLTSILCPSSGSLYFTAIIRSRASASSLSRSLAARRCSLDSHALDLQKVIEILYLERERDWNTQKFIQIHQIVWNMQLSSCKLGQSARHRVVQTLNTWGTCCKQIYCGRLQDLRQHHQPLDWLTVLQGKAHKAMES